jgi:hypothetical protein
MAVIHSPIMHDVTPDRLEQTEIARGVRAMT